MVRRQLTLRLYHNFALVMGITSHRMVDGKLRQTWLTRYYALILNIIILLILPALFWQSKENIEKLDWFPDFIKITTYVFYLMSSVTIVYTLISRGHRDSALVEMEGLVAKLKDPKNTFKYWIIERCLRNAFYLKFATVVYLTLTTLAMSFMAQSENSWILILCSLLLSLAMNLPIFATYRYFLALWNIASCYHSINCQLDGIIETVQAGISKTELKNLRRLWFFHLILNRCTLRINKIYGLLMLAARLDYVTFSVVDSYWGLLLLLSKKTPRYMLIYGTCNFMFRSLDFFLMDYICDLTAQYQRRTHDAVSEVLWHKEVNAFILYTGTSKMSFWVCGLYKVNKNRWFQMIGSIFNLFLLLLQFHLIMKVH